MSKHDYGYDSDDDKKEEIFWSSFKYYWNIFETKKSCESRKP